MIKQKQLVPKRRFEGFKNKEAWTKIVLGDNAIIKGRLGWKSLKREEYLDSGPSMIAGRHIKNGIINWNEVDHISLWRYEESPEIMLENQDVVFSKDGSLGNPALITNLREKATINATMMLIRTNKNLDPGYFYQILNSKYFLDLVKLKVSGSSIPHLFQEDMKKFNFFAPSIEGQQKIGQFFKHLDEMIALQQRKIDKTKTLKSAYLAEMFPAEGERVPKRRFEGFVDEWEVKKLADVVIEISDGDWIETEHIFNQGKYRIIQTGNLGIGRYIDRTKNAKYFHQEDFDQLKANEIFPEDILISRLAEPAGRTIILPETGFRMVTSVDVAVIRPNEKFDSTFLMTLMNSEKTLKEVNKEVTGTTHKRISRKNLERTELIVPEVFEQQKIGRFFKHLDEMIETHQQKLEKLKATKQAYLHEMFV